MVGKENNMELISREEVMRILKEDLDASTSRGDDERADACLIHYIEVENLPTIEEQKEGTWIHDIHYGLKLPEHRCSICGEWEYSDTESKYCPNCGAKMEESR